MKPLYASHYARELGQFLAYKHSLGIRYEHAQGTLQRFDGYVLGQQRHQRTRVPLDQLIAGWLAHGAGRHPVTVVNYLGVVRQFCLFRRRYDPKGFVPDRTWAPPSRASHDLFRPCSRPRTFARSCARSKTLRAPRWVTPAFVC